MATHKDLEIWKLSIEFATRIYKTTQSFPSKEILYELRTIKSKLINYIKYLKTLK